ncbi:hypothetical protein DXA62_15525 [Coprobacillus sp. OF03-2AA]|uniref:hypothetical protein n=1 Tax=Faecalibacillus intestinalis TaxID=1982626 RepID=UPI000E4AF306|nr:hypothetical protein [Faecalibacillus intestinalis]RHP66813.1 hypothetical protein DXA62_15525 [Coprobacillus sp. OF03-2AA]
MINFEGFLPVVPEILTTVVFYLSTGGLIISFSGLILEFLFRKKVSNVTDKMKLFGFSVVLISLVVYTATLSYYSITYFI